MKAQAFNVYRNGRLHGWLWGCALDPSPYMAKHHIRWIRLALKLRGFPFA